MVGIGRELRLALVNTVSFAGVDSPIYLQNRGSNMEYDIKSSTAIPVRRNTKSNEEEEGMPY